MSWTDLTRVGRGLLDAAADAHIDLVLRGVVRRCWRCRTHAAVPGILHPAENTDALCCLSTAADNELLYARELLAAAGSPLAATIQPRWSNAAGEHYLSNGCPACDAIFGQFFVQAAVGDAHLSPGVAALPVLLATTRPMVEWWALQSARDWGTPAYFAA